MVSNREAKAMGYRNKYEYKYGPPRDVGWGEAIFMIIFLGIVFLFL